jgi:regulator of RNase E activity RraA
MREKQDSELFDLVTRKLYTAVIGDILDRLGFTRQFFPPAIRPLGEDMRLVGRALPVRLEPVADERDREYGLLFEALDSLAPGEVFVAGGDCGDSAVWGELMTTRAQKLAAAGAVLDGPTRDSAAVLALRFPVFSRGSYARDQAGRAKVTAYGAPVLVGSVTVARGDLVVGDRDGVLAVPRAVEAEVITKALEKAGAENTVLRDLQAGMSAVEAFRKHGIF